MHLTFVVGSFESTLSFVEEVPKLGADYTLLAYRNLRSRPTEGRPRMKWALLKLELSTLHCLIAKETL